MARISIPSPKPVPLAKAPPVKQLRLKIPIIAVHARRPSMGRIPIERMSGNLAAVPQLRRPKRGGRY